VVNWITSTPNRHYRRYNACFIFQNEMGTAKPDSTGGPYFFQSIRGRPFDLKYVKDKDVADYVFACVPWDLNGRAIPRFYREIEGIRGNGGF
jgi:hypothetical protein